VFLLLFFVRPNVPRIVHDEHRPIDLPQLIRRRTQQEFDGTSLAQVLD